MGGTNGANLIMSNIEPTPTPGEGQELVEWIVQPPYGPTVYLNKYRVRNLGDSTIIDSVDRPSLEAEGLIAPLEAPKSLDSAAEADEAGDEADDEAGDEAGDEADDEADDEAGEEAPKTKKRK